MVKMVEWVEPWEWTRGEVITSTKLNTARQAILWLKENLPNRLWAQLATEDGPLPVGVSYQPETLDILGLRWREGKQGVGMAFHDPTNPYPHGFVKHFWEYYGPEQIPYPVRETYILDPVWGDPGPRLREVWCRPDGELHYWLWSAKGGGQHVLWLSYQESSDRVMMVLYSPSGGCELEPGYPQRGDLGTKFSPWGNLYVAVSRALKQVICVDTFARETWEITADGENIYAYNTETGRRYKFVLQEVT